MGILRQRLELARALVVILFACTMAGSMPAAAATGDVSPASVAATFQEANGYGRIVLTWPNGVPPHKEEIVSGVLVVSADRPFSTDLEEFVRRMPQYVAMARQDGDGKTLRVALKFDYWMNVQQAENSLYIDLLPRSWAGTPPSLPADVLARIAAAKAAKLKAEEEARLIREQGIVEPNAPRPGLNVRLAKHDGVTRLVFDWNQPVLYSLAQREGSATITFDRTASVSLAPIRVDPPPFLKTISAAEHEGRLSVFLKLAPGVRVTAFREDLGVVLDLQPDQPARTGAEAAPAADATSAPVAGAGHRPQTILPNEGKQADASKDQPVRPAGKSEKAEAPMPAPVGDAAPEAESAAPARGPIAVVSRDLQGRTELSFPWPAQAGAAVFTRAGTLWVVFDRAAKFDLSRVASDPARRIGKPVEVAVEDGAAFAFPILGKDLLVGVTQQGTDWRVSIGERISTAGSPIEISRAWRDTGEGVVSFGLKGARNVLRVEDPTARDTIDVATAGAPIQSNQMPRSFIEFQALQTAQGIAILPVADDLNVAVATDAVVVTRRGGLTLSADETDAGTDDAGSGAKTSVDFAAWRGVGGFNEGRQMHERAVAFSDAQGAVGARIDYARFLLGYGLGPEALTQLELAVAADPKIASDSSFRELRGIANVMAYHFPAAIADLSVNALQMDGYAAAWRGLARTALDQTDAARRDFDLAAPLIETMDTDLGERVSLAAASVDLAADDPVAARSHLARLPDKVADPERQAEALYLQGEIADKLHRPIEAVSIYDRAIAMNREPYAVSARFEKALVLNRTGALSDQKLDDELEGMRLMWRGGDIERRILSKLADLRLARGNVASALKIMRVISTDYPASDEARTLGARMPDIFADYFIDGQADKLPPVQALAVYHQFQDLTPLGKKGDELIRHLADELVSVDLLPQAEELLGYQIDHRLVGGFARAQVAARLASIYLLDDKPENALRVIRSTVQNLLPDDLDRQRRLIEARSLASLKRYDLALDLLSEMLGPDADALRADVLWEAERWDEAGKAAEVLLSEGAGERPLTTDDRFQVMRAAIAYSLADDEVGLQRIRTAFGKRMAATDDASAFAVVSDPIERQGVAFRELASRIAAMNTMERFVNSLKKMDKVSAIDGIPVASN